MLSHSVILPVSRIFAATLSSGAYPTLVLEQLLKHQLGVQEDPREFHYPLYTKSYQQTNSVKISSME